MGFRSNLVSLVSEDHINHPLPEWFIEKYKHVLHFNDRKTFAFSTKYETKEYGDALGSLLSDIQKAINWDEAGTDHIIVAYLHECGGVTKAYVRQHDITYAEPTGWEIVDEVQHGYGCGHGCPSCREVSGLWLDKITLPYSNHAIVV